MRQLFCGRFAVGARHEGLATLGGNHSLDPTPGSSPGGHESVRSRAGAVVGSVIFFGIAPGVVAGWIPYALSGWRFEPALLGFPAGRIAGGILVAIGLAVLVDCFKRFAIEGVGTPAPVAPTEYLVGSGPYRYVRNPMYLAVVSIILGQGILLGSLALLGYAGVVWLLFHVFVCAYEEPTFGSSSGSRIGPTRLGVGRWWPRMCPQRLSSLPPSTSRWKSRRSRSQGFGSSSRCRRPASGRAAPGRGRPGAG